MKITNPEQLQAFVDAEAKKRGKLEVNGELLKDYYDTVLKGFENFKENSEGNLLYKRAIFNSLRKPFISDWGVVKEKVQVGAVPKNSQISIPLMTAFAFMQNYIRKLRAPFILPVLSMDQHLAISITLPEAEFTLENSEGILRMEYSDFEDYVYIRVEDKGDNHELFVTEFGFNKHSYVDNIL